ncbi:hypothetical protein SUGI_0135470 [Cryptomeria japonica]|nr:hypothetical protein SUGI_0135470 [Cryptomeria japonica]
MDQDFLSKTQTSGEQFIEEKMPGSSQIGAPGTENQFSVMQERSGEESESTDNGDECNDESPMFESTSPESEQPMDIENNGILWIPPEPEDEEDEKETSVFDDDDDDDGGGWALSHSTGSFSDSEYKSKDRVSEEHRKAMRAVLDGHFRALVAQLLKAENVPVGEENNKESWLEIVISLSWQAASLVKPDTSKGGGGMDPGGYVKGKCLACGHPYQSEVIKGVVCKKNIANRRMTKSYKNPRLLILGGALEYQRVSNVLSSLDTLIQQEKEHLKMTVAKVEAHRPNVLLVEKSVSRPAQDYLLSKEISLVLNIKRPLLERIARCTGAQIVPSVDNLTAAKVGHCESFHVDKFVEEHDSAGQTGRNPPKTLMFFEGCPKPLGCMVLLKGSNSDELKKVKRVVQFAVFAAYHLAVETSFLADEGATLPELSLKSPITVALPDKISNFDRSISTIPEFMIPTSVQINKADMQFPPKGALTENSVVQQKDMHAIPENFSSLPPSGNLISELSSSIKKTFEEAVRFSSSKSHEGVTTYFNSADQRSNSSIIDSSLVTYTPGSVGHQFPVEENSHELQLENQENMENQPKATLFMDHKITGHDNHNNMHSEGQRPSKEDSPPPDQ